MEELGPILEQAQNGDKQAYGLLVRRFQDMAVGYAYTFLGDFALAEDAAQEAFIEAHAGLAKVYGPTAFPGWLRRIVFKHCDRLVRAKAQRALPLEAAGALVDHGPTVLERLEQYETAQLVRQAIDGLPDHQRRVVSLFYISDHSHKEIAAFLDVPVTTVQKRLHDARKRLKERISDMVKEHLHDNRPSKSDAFAQKILLLEEFKDEKKVHATWADFPELGVKDGALELNYRYRFAISVDFLSDLRAQRLSPALRQAFAEGGIELSDDTQLSQAIDGPSGGAEMWVLADRVGRMAYRIRLPWYEPKDRSAENELWVFNGLNYNGYAERVLLTERRDFSDFSIQADFSILSLTAGFVLRAQDRYNYYSVCYDLRCLPENEQFDSRSHADHADKVEKPCIEFARKSTAQGIKNRLISTALYPKEHDWYHMKVVVQGFDFKLYLGRDSEKLEEVAGWRDEHGLYRQGAIGFNPDVGSGESAIYKNLKVVSLD